MKGILLHIVQTILSLNNVYLAIIMGSTARYSGGQLRNGKSDGESFISAITDRGLYFIRINRCMYDTKHTLLDISLTRIHMYIFMSRSKIYLPGFF